MNKLKIPTTGGKDGVTVLKQSFDVQPLIQKQADCISVMTYNEYGQVLDAGFKPEDLTVFNYTKLGVNLLEDGLYTNETKLKDPAFKDKMVKFVRASMKGWKYAAEHPDEAAEIVVDNGGQDEAHQKFMAGEVAKLIGNGKLDKALYERTQKALLDLARFFCGAGRALDGSPIFNEPVRSADNSPHCCDHDQVIDLPGPTS
jgi:NitT/TauT family transport system substrate-binding protein